MNRSLVLVSLFISLGFFFRGNEALAFSKSETEHAVKGCVRDTDGNHNFMLTKRVQPSTNFVYRQPRPQPAIR